MKSFALIRHGRTEWNDKRRVQGRLDIPLSIAGRKEIYGLIDSIAAFTPSVIYSSPVRRAIESAEIIADHLDLKLCRDDAFTELDVGEWEGLASPELEKMASWRQYRLDPAVAKPDGGESLADLQRRSVRGVEAILAAGVVRCAIVTHGDIIRAVVCHYLNRPLSSLREFRVPLASVLFLEWPDDGPIAVTTYP